MGRTLFRLPPSMPVQAWTTYSIQTPISTHFRKATCAEVDCEAYRCGWRVHVEAIGPELTHAAKTSGARFVVQEVGPGHTYLVFEAGQICFGAARHRVRVGRPELFVVRHGDWRGNPSGQRRVHTDMAGWIDDMSTNRDKLMTRLARG